MCAVLVRRYRSVVGIHDFGDHQVLEQVHPSMLAALRSDPRRLGCRIDVVGDRPRVVVASRRVESVNTSDALKTNRGMIIKWPASCASASSRTIEA
jgi:hypothetical protein